MDLEELRSVQNAERNRGGLQPLRESFYEEVGQYIADLKAERDRAADRADDPWSSPEVKRLTDEIETAEEVVEAVYERRMGKILDRASLAASDMNADEEGLTAEERAMFRDLVARIEENKRTVLDTLDPATGGDDPDEGESNRRTAETREPDPPAGGNRDDPGERADSAPPADEQGAGVDHDRTHERGVPGGDGPDDRSRRPATGDDLSTADAMGPADDADPSGGDAGDDSSRPPRDTAPDGAASDGGRPPAGRNGSDDTDRVTVRITRDVGQILGIDDRQYQLEPEDVVDLPAENADPLVERDAAQRLD